MSNGPDMNILSTIYRVGRELGANDTQMAAAFSAALVETGARNLSHGDRDSLGVFQQRPGMAWGTAAQVQDPEYAARAFFSGAGTNRGALHYTDWDGTPGQLAQRVQRSAYPHRYDQRMDQARALMSQVASAQGEADPHALALPPTYDQASQFDSGRALADFFQGLSGGLRRQAQGERAVPLLDENLRAWVEPRPDDPVDPMLRAQLEGSHSPLWLAQRVTMPGDLGLVSEGSAKVSGGPRTSARAQEFITRASAALGVPYQWGGTNLASGVDCSGLIWRVMKDMGIDVPRVSRDQAKAGAEVASLDEALPGDLVAFPARGLEVGHIGIYLGGGKMLHAPRRGRNVEVADIGTRKIATIRRVFTQDRVTRL